MSTDLHPSDSCTFNYIQSNVGSWRDTADTLVETAYRLENDRDPGNSRFIESRFRNIYNMLMGFALENYYKGAILAKRLTNREHITADKLDLSIKKHQLAKLALDAGVMVKDRLLKSYLDYITECIRWRGRYPLPTTAKDIDDSMIYHPGDKCRMLIGLEHGIPIDAVHELIDQAKSNLDKCATKKDKKLKTQLFITELPI